jgi:outer membrane protein OmpA-like peptidoglycan-associated protein
MDGGVLTPGTISLTGAVPSEEARRKLLSGIAATVPGVTIDDHLLIDDSVSEQGLSDFPAVLGAIGELPGQGAKAVARVTWQGGTVVLSGTVLSRAAVDAAAEAATTLAGDPTKVTNTLEVAATETPANPAKSLQATIDRSPTITFATASCTLTPADRSTVRRIAAAIKTADHHATGDSPPSVVLSIDGFADSRGPVDYNLDLGRCRARSVYRTLVGLGVDAEQLTVRSFGEAHPIASNRTVAGRAANRRVEIHITG